MQALIDFIIRNVLQLVPFARVYEWQVGMMVRKGRIQRDLAPGIHWRWWFIDEARTWPRVECVVSLSTGAVTTADGESIAIDGNIGYAMVDIAKAFRRVWNTEASVKALAMGIICSTIAQRPWRDLQGDSRAPLEAELLEKVNAATTEWGIAIKRVHLVACVRARQHRHFLDGTLGR